METRMIPADARPSPRLTRPVVAVVGATGAVGGEFLRCLERRRFPLSALRLFASARSAGRTMDFAGAPRAVEVLTEHGLAGVDIALFSAGSSVAKEFAPVAVRQGAIVIDNSSAFRMRPEVPLVVPEINAAATLAHSGIIANPNCVAAIAVTALWPIHRHNRIRRLIASTYQAASGAGAAAMDELRRSTRAALDDEAYPPRVLRHPAAFNLFSHDAAIDPSSGYNGEEIKIVNETRKILGDPNLRIGITCIRVPVLRAHSMALTIECETPIAPDAVRRLLAAAPGSRLSTMLKPIAFQCLSTPLAGTRFWSAVFARTSAIPAADRSPSSSPAISC
jgi:aspartate-semialdehyde dehydrogenase